MTLFTTFPTHQVAFQKHSTCVTRLDTHLNAGAGYDWAGHSKLMGVREDFLSLKPDHSAASLGALLLVGSLRKTHYSYVTYRFKGPFLSNVTLPRMLVS